MFQDLPSRSSKAAIQPLSQRASQLCHQQSKDSKQLRSTIADLNGSIRNLISRVKHRPRCSYSGCTTRHRVMILGPQRHLRHFHPVWHLCQIPPVQKDGNHRRLQVLKIAVVLVGLLVLFLCSRIVHVSQERHWHPSMELEG